jgi:hypothetical protein
MDIETIFKIIYHASGVVVAAFFLAVVIILTREKQEVIKSRIFIKYSRFKSAFYIAFSGAVLFLIGNLLALFSDATFHWLHEVTEIIYNLCLVAFVGILYFILRTVEYNE